VDEEDLTVALRFAQDGFAHQTVVIFSDIGLDGQAVFGGVSIVLKS